jgi:hypothetical protein
MPAIKIDDSIWVAVVSATIIRILAIYSSDCGNRKVEVISRNLLQRWEQLLHQPFFVDLEGFELLGLRGEEVVSVKRICCPQVDLPHAMRRRGCG